MDGDTTPRPECFGTLEMVFPMEKDGLRNTPIACRACVFRTECLRAAVESRDGLAVKDETVDRAYRSGMMNFFERWSKKKEIDRKRRASAKTGLGRDRS